jgi:uncharacterized membrane protein YkvI
MKQRVGIWNVTKCAGSWISFCIGSGFATGTGIIQIYGPHGAKGIGIGLIGMALMTFFAYAFTDTAFKNVCHNSMDLFEYYCGPFVGKAFKWLTVVFLFLSPLCMVSGFGATLSQQWGYAPWVGSVAMAIACLITVLLGLKKLVDIVGAVGPVIAILCIAIGGYSFICNIDGLSEGLRASAEIDIVKYSKSWVVSGLLEAAWAPLILGPFVLSFSKTVRTKTEARLGSILGIVGYYAATALVVLCYFCQYAEVCKNPIPTLYIVNSINPAFGRAFVIIVALAVYSSAVPSQFNFCDTFAQEKTALYTLIAIISILASCVASFFIDFTILFNRIYVFYSYASWIFIFCMIYKHLKFCFLKKV